MVSKLPSNEKPLQKMKGSDVMGETIKTEEEKEPNKEETEENKEKWKKGSSGAPG